MSKERLCIIGILFLSSIELVDHVVNYQTTVTINEKPIKIGKYFNTDKRKITLNVCPTIPNEIIQKELNNIGIITPPDK